MGSFRTANPTNSSQVSALRYTLQFNNSASGFASSVDKINAAICTLMSIPVDNSYFVSPSAWSGSVYYQFNIGGQLLANESSFVTVLSTMQQQIKILSGGYVLVNYYVDGSHHSDDLGVSSSSSTSSSSSKFIQFFYSYLMLFLDTTLYIIIGCAAGGGLLLIIIIVIIIVVVVKKRGGSSSSSYSNSKSSKLDSHIPAVVERESVAMDTYSPAAYTPSLSAK